MKNMSTSTKVLIGIGIAVVILILFILGLSAYGPKWKVFQSADYPYTVKFDSARYEYEKLLLDNKGIYMERFRRSGQTEDFYLSVIQTDPEVKLSEVLTEFQKDNSYTFTIDENAVFGEGSYPAIRIAYTDTSGSEPVTVEYYYMKEKNLLVTVCESDKTREDIEAMLASFTIVK